MLSVFRSVSLAHLPRDWCSEADGLPLATHRRAELHPNRALLHQSRDGRCTPLDTH